LSLNSGPRFEADHLVIRLLVGKAHGPGESLVQGKVVAGPVDVGDRRVEDRAEREGRAPSLGEGARPTSSREAYTDPSTTRDERITRASTAISARLTGIAAAATTGSGPLGLRHQIWSGTGSWRRLACPTL